jgi:site-specific DNA-methyltransferase (adenine-specific)
MPHIIAEISDFNVRWKSPDGTSLFVEADAFEFLDAISENSVDCIWTDPPYLLSNDGITCVAGKMVRVNKGEWDRSQGIELDHQFNRGWIEKCHRVLKPGGTIWISGTVHVYLSVGMALLQQGFRILNDITWEKPAPPPNLGRRCFTHSTELLLWATKATQGSKHRYTFNYEQMRNENSGRQMKTVWRISTPSREEKELGKHPTQKPVELVGRCLRASTNPGDIVLDPFAGSGTTAIAALRLRRRFIGCERDGDFADLAVRRIEATVKKLSQPRLLDEESLSTSLRASDGAD